MILDTIAVSTRNRVEKAKIEKPLEALKAEVYDKTGVRSFNGREAFAFERALKKASNYKQSAAEASTTKAGSPGTIAFICEVKKASPSKGLIADSFPYLEIAKDYERAGAAAISVLTEPEYFKGDNRYLSEISCRVQIPVLRKDFIVDEYQIYEAKLLGADAVLLICTLLSKEDLKKYLSICNELGLSALVEAHTREELITAVDAGARIIGVNNRNLQTFEVDLYNSVRLRSFVPEHILFVAESGIKTAGDIEVLSNSGVNAVLIGETLMKSPDRKKALSELRGTQQ